jgi:hypothetical protein
MKKTPENTSGIWLQISEDFPKDIKNIIEKKSRDKDRI